ncbi:hypothetical protein [Methylobacterium tardum]|uniref:hypothetical protein n=1 Tax=Methylobacterium tardum TaxID=374432 RepID=UPI0036140AB2
MAQQTITALYDRYEDASAAVGELESVGIPHSDVSLVSNNEEIAMPAASPAARTEPPRRPTGPRTVPALARPSAPSWAAPPAFSPASA